MRNPSFQQGFHHVKSEIVWYNFGLKLGLKYKNYLSGHDSGLTT